MDTAGPPQYTTETKAMPTNFGADRDVRIRWLWPPCTAGTSKCELIHCRCLLVHDIHHCVQHCGLDHDRWGLSLKGGSPHAPDSWFQRQMSSLMPMIRGGNHAFCYETRHRLPCPNRPWKQSKIRHRAG